MSTQAHTEYAATDGHIDWAKGRHFRLDASGPVALTMAQPDGDEDRPLHLWIAGTGPIEWPPFLRWQDGRAQQPEGDHSYARIWYRDGIFYMHGLLVDFS